jgi:hypothetical protein
MVSAKLRSGQWQVPGKNGVKEKKRTGGVTGCNLRLKKNY